MGEGLGRVSLYKDVNFLVSQHKSRRNREAAVFSLQGDFAEIQGAKREISELVFKLEG